MADAAATASGVMSKGKTIIGWGLAATFAAAVLTMGFAPALTASGHVAAKGIGMIGNGLSVGGEKLMHALPT